MAPLAILYLRSDVSWGQLTEAKYVNQQKYNSSVLPISTKRKELLLSRIKIWNRCFGLSYFDYRQHLKDIADWSRSRISGVDLIIRNRHRIAILRQLGNVIVIPTDDDDWFAPDIVNQIRGSSCDGTDVIHWNDAVCCPVVDQPSPGARSRRVLIRESRSEHFWTNSYAITARGLKRCPPDSHSQVLDSHMKTLPVFRASVNAVQNLYIPSLLSMTVKSPASFTKLKDVISSEMLLNMIPQLLSPTGRLPAAVEWAEPMISQMEDLNRRLANSARIAPPASVQIHGETARTENHWLRGPLSRTSVINSIARRFDYRSYLEIGCGKNENFSAVQLTEKTGIDPRRGGTHRMTSDAFFESNARRFDLVFVDGDQAVDQVSRDIENALRTLNDGGCILVHDCLPKGPAQQFVRADSPSRTGEVWKAIIPLRRRVEIDVAVLGKCCGLGAILKRNNTRPLRTIPPLTWDTFHTHGRKLLRVLEPREFEEFLLGTLSP